MIHSSEATDFDFLMGEWEVRDLRLAEWLTGSDEWNEYAATLDARPLLGGLANMDQFRGTLGGEPFEGVSLRLFDAEEKTWTIYWMDTNGPRLIEQVTGSFKDGVGEFFGEESFKGEPVPMRFLWKDITNDSARWEQAYYDEPNDAWETNWIMEFTRVSE